MQFLRYYEGSADGKNALRWMLFVSKRCAWEIARRRRRRREDLYRSIHTGELGGSEGDALVEPGGGPAELAEHAEEVDRVLAAIERLAPDERTALILFGLGCSYAEIGRPPFLGPPPVRVTGLALTRFRGHLTSWERSAPGRSQSATNQTAVPAGVSR